MIMSYACMEYLFGLCLMIWVEDSRRFEWKWISSWYFFEIEVILEQILVSTFVSFKGFLHGNNQYSQYLSKYIVRPIHCTFKIDVILMNSYLMLYFSKALFYIYMPYYHDVKISRCKDVKMALNCQAPIQVQVLFHSWSFQYQSYSAISRL